jgi:glucosamine--fructose-6-phosphate aminotransferase (isomerizing)
VVAYLSEARRQGAPTVAIVNDTTSPLAKAADHVLACDAGPELSIPATKTVTAQMTLLAMLSSALDEPTRNQLEDLPAAVQSALDRRNEAAHLAQGLARSGPGAVIGRGFAFPPALEIALKLKETSYTHAEPFSAADFLHGPIALVEAGYSALLVDAGGRSTQSALESASAIHRRGGEPVLLRAGKLRASDVNGFQSLSVDAPVPESIAPIVALVLGQLLAVEVALALGLDPARPRYLHKVTSTR